jgi:hypothetical protein
MGCAASSAPRTSHIAPVPESEPRESGVQGAESAEVCALKEQVFSLQKQVANLHAHDQHSACLSASEISEDKHDQLNALLSEEKVKFAAEKVKSAAENAKFEQLKSLEAKEKAALEQVAEAVECLCCLEPLAPGSAVAFNCGHTYCNRATCASSSQTHCPECRQEVTARVPLFGSLSNVSTVLLINSL